MDLITFGLSKIRKTIPKQILDIRYNIVKATYSNVNMNIEDIVIRGDVLIDMNLVSCNQLVVKVSDLKYLGLYGDKMIYDVPSILTNGLAIMDVIAVIGEQGFAVDKTVEANIGIPSTTRVYLVNRHTISIDKEFFSATGGYVELTLAYDDRMKEIMPVSYPDIAKAFILATKADIYNELIIDLDEGALYYGHDIGSIKSKIEEYADTRELYDTYMDETVARVLFMNSDDAMQDWITGLLPNSQ